MDDEKVGKSAESAFSRHLRMRGAGRLLAISAAVLGSVCVLYLLYSSTGGDRGSAPSLVAAPGAGMDRDVAAERPTVAAIPPTLHSIYTVHARDVDGNDFNFETLRGKVRVFSC